MQSQATDDKLDPLKDTMWITMTRDREIVSLKVKQPYQAAVIIAIALYLALMLVYRPIGCFRCSQGGRPPKITQSGVLALRG